MRNYILLLGALLLLSASCKKETYPISNLKTFAKAYGYVKYFHPSNEAANIDWNTFAALGAEEISKCKNQKEVINTLNQLFQPVGPGIQFSKTKQGYDLKKITPVNTEDYQPTYWQHLGVSTPNMRYQYPQTAYRSVRVNQFSEINEAAYYGNLFTSVHVDKYKSKEIKYTGWVKLKSGSAGTGHLWMRIYKPDKTEGFFANMDATPVTSTEWKQYEIIGTIEDLAASVTIGGYIIGEGTVYIDDTELFYKEKEKWVEIPFKNNDFEAEEIGVKNEQTEWRGTSKGYSYEVSTTENKEGKQCAVIDYKGQFKKVKGDTIFATAPKFGELIEKEIGDGIFCQIPLTLYGNEESTYPKSNQLGTLQEQLSTVDKQPTSLSVRLGNVLNAYNVFHHFYPYFDVVNANWEKAFETALKRSFSDQTGDDHLVTLQKFTAPLKDGHVAITGGNKLYNFTPSIFWQWMEGKLVITHVFDDSLNLRIGDVVTKVNNLTTEAYFQEVYDRISSATKGHLNYRSQITSLLGEKDTELTIEVNNTTLHLKRDKAYETYNFTGIDIQKNAYQLLAGDIFYININSIAMDTFTHLLPKLTQAKGIICDLRGYPNYNHDILSHLTNKNITSEDWFKIPKIIYPDQENIIGYDASGWGELKVKEPYLGDKKIVFLTDGRAISQAESYMSMVKSYNLATIVGEPTAGTNGMINPFNLLGNYSIIWTGMKVINPDGSQFHAIGILPDIYVEKTIEGVKAGKDEFLERAIEFINKS